MKMRMPIVYPATAALPNELMIRTMAIQLVCATANWSTPVLDTRMSEPITRGTK